MKSIPLIHNSSSELKAYFLQESWADFLLQHIHPAFSLYRVLAKVSKIKQETKDVKTYTLFPNFHWKGFKAGQYLPVSLTVGGKRHTRLYSISCKPGEKTISITVKQKENGFFSSYLHEQVRVGDYLELGKAEGNFFPEEEGDEPLLFIAAGCGITPVYSNLQELSVLQDKRDVKLLYFVPDKESVIFQEELKYLKKHTDFQLHIFFTREKREGYNSGHFSLKLLKEYIPDFKERKAFLCGPSSLIEAVQDVYQKEAILKNLKTESFTPYVNTVVTESDEREVKLLRSHKTLRLSKGNDLLSELEKNGIYPQSACRMGICHTCKCEKKSGQIKNLINGNVSGLTEEHIQLCISTIETDIELEL